MVSSVRVACITAKLVWILQISEALIPESRADDERPLCACGSNASPLDVRVVGGHDALVNQFPFATGLTRSDVIRSSSVNYVSTFCGGSLITDRHVLTAAHCVRDRKTEEVILDINDYNVSDGKLSTDFRQAISMRQYPEYKRIGFLNDIAIIEFDIPVNLGEKFKAAWLPPPSYEMKPGTTVTVYGWGRLGYFDSRPQVLQTVELPLMDYEECQSEYRITIHPDMMLCAGGEKGKDACIGDSGSGLLARIDNEYVLVGTVSFGRQCALEHVPGVYAKVSSYVDWIYDQTRNASCRPCVVSYENFV